MNGVVIVAQAQQQGVLCIKGDLILYKSTGQVCPGGCILLLRIGCSRGIVIIISIAIADAAEQIVPAQHFVPDQLSKGYILLGEVEQVAIGAVLVMGIGAELENEVLL